MGHSCFLLCLNFSDERVSVDRTENNVETVSTPKEKIVTKTTGIATKKKDGNQQ